MQNLKFTYWRIAWTIGKYSPQDVSGTHKISQTGITFGLKSWFKDERYKEALRFMQLVINDISKAEMGL